MSEYLCIFQNYPNFHAQSNCAHSELFAHNCLKRPVAPMHPHPSLSQFNLQTCCARYSVSSMSLLSYCMQMHVLGCVSAYRVAQWHKNTDSRQTQTTQHLRDVRRARSMQQCTNITNAFKAYTTFLQPWAPCPCPKRRRRCVTSVPCAHVAPNEFPNTLSSIISTNTCGPSSSSNSTARGLRGIR